MLSAIRSILPRIITKPSIRRINLLNSSNFIRLIKTNKNKSLTLSNPLNSNLNLASEKSVEAETKNVQMPVMYHTIAALSLILFGTAFGFLTVPLYRLFCQQTGFGGTVKEKTSMIDIEPQEGKFITVRFDRMVHPSLPWEFTPQQEQITVTIGEPALAFYKAKNVCDEPITGISTYSMVPFYMARYFVKVQCFCFEEQRLEPGEEVDMPVFFYVDPSILESSAFYQGNYAILNYMFFKSKSSEYYEQLRSNDLLPLPKSG